MKIDHRKLLRFLLAGGPTFVGAILLNYVLVHWLELGKALAYATVLTIQTTANFLICRAFVFKPNQTSNIWTSFVLFFNGILLFRVMDWVVYVLLTNHFGLPFIGVQLFNVALFGLLKFEFARRVFENEKKSGAGQANILDSSKRDCTFHDVNVHPMKLVIQIPCLNEEQTLAQTIRDLPKRIPGIDEIEILVVDDGSKDRTAAVARACGAQVLSLETNRGLARAFTLGLERAMTLGADIVVNTDADNQYRGDDITRLVEPILQQRADMVVGCRPIVNHPEFGVLKKALQLLGSWALRTISKTKVRDAASGFRAFSREACLRLYVHSRFSYCMETLIQAGNSRLRVVSVDIQVNPKTRPSRLFKSIPEYVVKSGSTILAMFVLYRPGRFFGLLASVCLTGALLLGVRFIYLIYLFPSPSSTRVYHIPSLILLAVLALTGILLAALGIIGELIRAQRSLTEETLYQLRCQAAVTSLKKTTEEVETNSTPVRYKPGVNQ